MKGVFPEHFLNKMSATDRRRLGQMTIEEANRQYERGQEKELKREVVNWLNRHGIYWFTQPMSKRTRGQVGTPDIFACYRGIFLGIELKARGQRLTREQAEECIRIRSSGGKVCVAFCLGDVTDAISMIDQELGPAKEEK